MAKNFYVEHLTKEDILQVSRVNEAKYFDIFKNLVAWTKDNEDMIKILTPIYEQMYHHQKDSKEKVENHLKLANRALLKASENIGFLSCLREDLPAIELLNLRKNDKNVHQMASRHVLIAIAGFLSKDVDH